MIGINWFSPMPPEKTDVAHYSQRIMAALRERLGVTVWTTQAEPTLEARTFTCIRRYDPKSVPWPELNRADLNIYNIGNNCSYHAAIWQVSRRSPGVVVLHDECLQHLFGAFFLSEARDLAAYQREMSRFYGAAGSAALAEYIGGRSNTEELSSRFPLTELALEKCLGVIVHSRVLLDRVAELTPAPVLYAPLPYAAPASEEQQRWLSLQKAGSTRIRLAVFGYIGPNRRLAQIIEAIAGHPDADRFDLDIYGPVWDAVSISNHARRFGLGTRVRIHGYVDDLDGALASANLVLNLRYPSMGEASGTQLRIWSHALPSLVTRIGWYASLPEDSVAFVRPENEIEDIRLHLSRLIAQPAKFEEMGKHGRAVLLRDHRPDKYAEALALMISHALHYRAQFEALDLASRVGKELGGFSTEYAREVLSNRTADAICSFSMSEVRPSAAEKRGNALGEYA